MWWNTFIIDALQRQNFIFLILQMGTKHQNSQIQLEFHVSPSELKSSK